jgi:ribose 5-phosphate isomerase A
VRLRTAGKSNEPFITDGGNYILDARAKLIGDAEALAAALQAIPGVVEHGLFIGMASTVVLGREAGATVLPKSAD